MAAKKNKNKNPKKGASNAADAKTAKTVVATNRQARRDYDIVDTIECGMVLRGSEAKSLRESKVTLGDAFGRIDRGEMYIIALHISPYSHAAHHTGHDPDRHRKLLLHRHQIDSWQERQDRDRLTLVPLSLYFVGNRAKVEMGLARGKSQVDRRRDIAKRDSDRDIAKAMSDNLRRRG